MSEDKKNTSGIKPEVLKPTVIGGNSSPAKITPTVIKTSQTEKPSEEKNNSIRKPTVIDLPSESSATVTPPRPVTTTIVTKPTEIKNRPMPLPIVSQASTMPGIKRTPLNIESSVLISRFPGTSEKTLEEACRIINCVFLDALTVSECAQWGVECQRFYGKLADDSLKLAASKKVQDSGRHLSRLYELLQELAKSFQEKETFWRKPETPWEKLQRIQSEIEQLRLELDQNLPELLAIEGKLEALTNESKKLIVSLDAHSLAALYLADVIKDQRVTPLAERSNSLLQTMANVQESIVLRQTTIFEIGGLAKKIQDAVLIALPAWLECTAVLVGKLSCTETEMYKAHEGLREIVDKLK